MAPFHSHCSFLCHPVVVKCFFSCAKQSLCVLLDMLLPSFITLQVLYSWLVCYLQYNVYTGDVRYDGVRLGASPKSFLNKSCNKSIVTQLLPNQYHVNMFMYESRYSFASRHFSSSSTVDRRDAVASDAGTTNGELHQKLLPSRGTHSSLVSPHSLLTGSSGPADATLSHVGESGKAKMVDVGSKSATLRVATASGRVKLGDPAFWLVAENRLKKGDVLSTAQLAGIMAAKQTSRLIPLCHNIVLTSVDVTLSLDSASLSVVVECTARSCGQTGVEMEALTGVSVAALTVYDMCKSASHDIVVSDIQLVSKTGGKSDFCRR